MRSSTEKLTHKVEFFFPTSDRAHAHLLVGLEELGLWENLWASSDHGQRVGRRGFLQWKLELSQTGLRNHVAHRAPVWGVLELRAHSFLSRDGPNYAPLCSLPHHQNIALCHGRRERFAGASAYDRGYAS
jgi:hypothetical protein